MELSHLSAPARSLRWGGRCQQGQYEPPAGLGQRSPLPSKFNPPCSRGSNQGDCGPGRPSTPPMSHSHSKDMGGGGVEEEQDADAETPPRDRSHHRQLTPCDMFLKTRYLQ